MTPNITGSITPDFTALQIARDVWSEPFWAGAEDNAVRMPACSNCGTFRWPAGPFCPSCHTQGVEWRPAGQARIYSFTVLPVPGEGPPRVRIPALVEFADAPGVRLVSVLVDADPAAVAIGLPVSIDWIAASDGKVPVFRMEPAA
ncbi:Zn-ribbon domain-containing OB-fold protein [Novosphingobium resinovorum]|uniref:Zn-ribbon domain-containing OB-fold protein n=1 Tax=Novosphingobium resinovorum TaxID=158500 RepID=UPI002ED417AA|nr:OB-fold domain-containing protein [Novosphingobium resinovorum]